MAYGSSDKTVCSAKCHLIWCPKHRRYALGGRCEARLKELVDEVLGEVGGHVAEVEVVADYVHLLGEVPPAMALSRLVQPLKGRSSRGLRKELNHLRLPPDLFSPCGWAVPARGSPGGDDGSEPSLLASAGAA